MPYLIPERDDFEIQRADMSLGMRRAARYYNELVVPGIGGAWRVRHLSWPTAGIFLKQQMQGKQSAIAIAHGIEALGNKLEWYCTVQSSRMDLRLRGIRAFARSQNSWTFNELSQKKFYVQITHRQQCTRALPSDSGLCFTQGSNRFNSMSLTTVGSEIAMAFLDRSGVGQGSPKLRTNLQNWVNGEFDPVSNPEKLKVLLSPLSPTEEERRLVLGRLQSMLPASSEVGLRDPQRRERLIRFLDEKVQSNADWSDTGSLMRWLETTSDGSIHAKDILTAIAFEDMRTAGVKLVGHIAQILSNATAPLPVIDCARNTSVTGDINTFRDTANKYLLSAEDGRNLRPDAREFAEAALLDDIGIIRALLRREGRILSLSGDAIYPGPVYRFEFSGFDAVQDTDQEAHFQGRPSRLFQFIALWRDCHGQN